MHQQDIATHGLPSVYAYLIIFAFILVSAAMVYAHKSKWAKLATPFKTDKRLPADPDKRYKTIRINRRIFRHLVCIPTQTGLYLSHWGLIPELLVRDRVLVPWLTCSDLIPRSRTVLGITVTEYFIDIRTPAGIVELMITKNIVEQIIQDGFLRLSSPL